jgi:hypothetical protein
MSRKGLLAAAVFAALLCLGSLWALRTRAVNQQQCLNNMRQLHGAAVSYCLMERLSPTSVLSVATLSPYLKSGIICPAGQSGYAPFSVLNGPVCPNGHAFEPGVPRPFRAPSTNDKVGGLYLEFGFTNLIDQAEPSGPATGSQPNRSETNRTSSASDSPR